MRVIAGIAKGHRLRSVPGSATRPVSDRVKENLFNILGNWTLETRWLDLFAGTGQVGIEALSRGARQAVFVDLAQPAIRVIEFNLKHTKLASLSEVRRMDAFDYLRGFAGERFDVIYVAPPQYHDLWSKTLLTVDEQVERYLSQEGMVIVQIHPKEYQAIETQRLRLFDRRKYGSTLLCFYEAGVSTSS